MVSFVSAKYCKRACNLEETSSCISTKEELVAKQLVSGAMATMDCGTFCVKRKTNSKIPKLRWEVWLLFFLSWTLPALIISRLLCGWNILGLVQNWTPCVWFHTSANIYVYVCMLLEFNDTPCNRWHFKLKSHKIGQTCLISSIVSFF